MGEEDDEMLYHGLLGFNVPVDQSSASRLVVIILPP
jgi:hypothetical protein